VASEAISPTSRIRRGFWAFCDFLIAQGSDLSRHSFMKVARIGCSEDFVPSPGRVLMYWSTPAGFFEPARETTAREKPDIRKSSKVKQLQAPVVKTFSPR
jgi:hypothetical protein